MKFGARIVGGLFSKVAKFQYSISAGFQVVMCLSRDMQILFFN